jgi:hypothetical protein
MIAPPDKTVSIQIIKSLRMVIIFIGKVTKKVEWPKESPLLLDKINDSHPSDNKTPTGKMLPSPIVGKPSGKMPDPIRSFLP